MHGTCEIQMRPKAHGLRPWARSPDHIISRKTIFRNVTLKKKHIDGPLGVAGRNSDNNLIYEKLGWKPNMKLIEGLRKTYEWIKSELK